MSLPSSTADHKTSEEFMTAQAPAIKEKRRVRKKSALRSPVAPKRNEQTHRKNSSVKFSHYALTWSNDGEKGKDKVKIARSHSEPLSYGSSDTEPDDEPNPNFSHLPDFMQPNAAASGDTADSFSHLPAFMQPSAATDATGTTGRVIPRRHSDGGQTGQPPVFYNKLREDGEGSDRTRGQESENTVLSPSEASISPPLTSTVPSKSPELQRLDCEEDMPPLERHITPEDSTNGLGKAKAGGKDSGASSSSREYRPRVRSWSERRESQQSTSDEAKKGDGHLTALEKLRQLKEHSRKQLKIGEETKKEGGSLTALEKLKQLKEQSRKQLGIGVEKKEQEESQNVKGKVKQENLEASSEELRKDLNDRDQKIANNPREKEPTNMSEEENEKEEVEDQQLEEDDDEQEKEKKEKPKKSEVGGRYDRLQDPLYHGKKPQKLDTTINDTHDLAAPSLQDKDSEMEPEMKLANSNVHSGSSKQALDADSPPGHSNLGTDMDTVYVSNWDQRSSLRGEGRFVFWNGVTLEGNFGDGSSVEIEIVKQLLDQIDEKIADLKTQSVVLKRLAEKEYSWGSVGIIACTIAAIGFGFFLSKVKMDETD